jgi:membrane dipeptidase
MYLVVDAHEDLAWNIQTYGRDYSRSAHETRRLEAGGVASQANGDTLLGYADYHRGRVAVVFATLFAAPLRARVDESDTLVYETASQARQLYRGQLETYYRLVDSHPRKFRLVLSAPELEAHLSAWAAEPIESERNEHEEVPVGLVPLMEGAEGIVELEELEEWYERGLRILGPAWRGNRFCGGTHEPGPLTSDGMALLEAMSALGLTLDLSHMDRQAALQALDRYNGSLIASHSNALRLVRGSDSNRHLADEVIAGIIERGGIIGLVAYNRFLVHGWTPNDPRSAAPLDLLAAQIDAICQMAGDARHAAIGTDFDGGFGVQEAPEGIDTIADLQQLAPLLEARGYNQSDIAAIFGGNWIAHLRANLPNG